MQNYECRMQNLKSEAFLDRTNRVTKRKFLDRIDKIYKMKR